MAQLRHSCGACEYPLSTPKWKFGAGFSMMGVDPLRMFAPQILAW